MRIGMKHFNLVNKIPFWKMTRNLKRLFRRTAKMDREEVTSLGSSLIKKRTVEERDQDSKTSWSWQSSYSAEKVPELGRGNTFRAKNGHGISKHYTIQQENRSREADTGLRGVILERKGFKISSEKNKKERRERKRGREREI